ncbi:hypothetical protein D9M71_603140 [compost metagenome]
MGRGYLLTIPGVAHPGFGPDAQSIRFRRPVGQPPLNRRQRTGIPLVLVVGILHIQGPGHAQQGLLAHIFQRPRHQIEQRLAIRGKVGGRQAIGLFIVIAQDIEPELLQAEHAVGMCVEIMLERKVT